tara:strand:- start:651 stop:1094 length:444 start_codon:yes stop_codon:yes gene_type:complete
MATGLLNGTDLLLKVGDSNANEVVVAFATSCSLELSADEIDQTNKDSGGWKSIIQGTRSWSVSADAMYQNEAEASKKAFTDFFAKVNTRTKVFVELTISNALGSDNNVYYSGEAFVSSLSVNGGTEDQATFSISLTGSGVLSETAAA